MQEEHSIKIGNFMFPGSLSHEEDNTVDASAGFATVEESDVGTKKVDRS